MNFKICVVALFAFAACNRQIKENNVHGGETHEEVKFQYTSYSNAFELFAEADAFVVGETANVLSHFSLLPDFTALESGEITMILSVNGKEIRQTLGKPTRKGIYSFDIKPETEGVGSLKFEIVNDQGKFAIIVPEVLVFANDEDARTAAQKVVVPNTNTTVFTKEQSWKVDLLTSLPETEPFGLVVKTTALVQSGRGNEQIVVAKSAGIVVFNSNAIVEGQEVMAGQPLFAISGSAMADNNLSVKIAGAKSSFERANAEYERAKELAKDKIVSDKDFRIAKNEYENSKVYYENLRKNFSASGQSVTSPMSGFVKQIFVKNGEYVEAGQAVVEISQNKTLVLTADVPQRYASILGAVQSANIRTIHDNQTYTFAQLNGKVLSFGKSANPDNYLIPITIQIDNKGGFISGSFVELYLKAVSNATALTIPNTALLEDQGSFFVWVQVTPELFEKREVHIGSTDGVKTEIIKGILANERIVIRGAMLIKLAQVTGTLDAHSGHVH